MQEHSFLSEFSDDDVIEFEENNLIKMKKLRNALVYIIENQLDDTIMSWVANQGIKIPSSISIIDSEGQSKKYNNKFLKRGVNGEILELGSKNWKKGKIKIRVSVEFEPDEPEIKEPESPLDDIRQSMNQ